MAQDGTTAGGSSYTIDNVTFPVGRTKLQSIFDAIRSTNIGNTAPDLVAGQFWIDNNTPSTTVWTLYFYDGTDNISFATIDTINNTVNFLDSTFDLINDTTPQLGGNLDLNSNDITGTGNINITGTGTFSGDLTVDTNTLYVDSTNNRIGIGTASPGSSLHIAQDTGTNNDWTNAGQGLYIVNSSSTKPASIKLNNATVGQQIVWGGAVGDSYFALKNYSAERMRIDSSGNLLLNTSSAKGDDAVTFAPVLTVNGGSYDGLIEVAGNRSDQNNAGVAKLQFIQNSNSATYKEVAEIRVETEGTTANQRGGRINFRTRADGSTNTTERMRIASNGDISFYEDTGTTPKMFWDASTERLGIGTSSPVSKLTVAGQITATSGATSAPTYSFDVDTNTGISRPTTDAVNIVTNGLERMRITSSGNVGIGTSSPTTKLDIVGTGVNGIELGQQSDNTGNSSRLFFNNSTNIWTAYSTTGNFKIASGATIGSSSGTDRLVIDSSGRVGIGTSSLVGTFNIETSNNNHIYLKGTTGEAYGLWVADDGNRLNIGSWSGHETIRFDSTNQNIQFRTATGAERMRIDSSGRLLVGTTTTTIVSTPGIRLYEDGRMFATSDGNYAIYLNRLTSDGNIASFNKDGTEVGRIGTLSGLLGIGNGDAGLLMAGIVDAVAPYNASTNATRDAAINLGTDTNRFKDLYLSGGVYVGGTGSANLLDDYEEGTFTPTVTGATSGDYTTGDGATKGSYVKIGNQVTIRGEIHLTAKNSPVGAVRVGNLPFTCEDLTELSERSVGSCWTTGFDLTADTRNVTPYIFGGQNRFTFIETKDNGAKASVDSSSVESGDEFVFTLTYQTA